MSYKSLLIIPTILLLAAAHAVNSEEPAKVETLLTEQLVGVSGKEVVMLKVHYLPGGSSLPHRHDANVFVYVLEGAIKTQVDGQPVKTVKAGETFRERPTDIHRVSANASATEPATFVVFMVKDSGKPVLEPVTDR